VTTRIALSIEQSNIDKTIGHILSNPDHMLARRGGAQRSTRLPVAPISEKFPRNENPINASTRIEKGHVKPLEIERDIPGHQLWAANCRLLIQL